ncbi:NYN domain-containing protein [Demequina pelophila]|uniref:NYN domain-containing protein n=1 Tax=Demequina pelophila TaxID=1638984 RepID=UPI00078165FD|nr:NYN domain-containing protein [Demequina pelophila]
MRSNAIVYVDAGYLLASAATRLTGSSFRRGIQPDFPALISVVRDQAERVAGRPVLRSYWYDAAPHQRPDDDHRVIEMVERVKLRLGRIGTEGQQKGVDLKIGLDMVTHARNGAIDTLILMSGDDDLTEAVDQAQASGVEVIVLAVPDAEGRPHGVSRHLHAAADRLEVVDPDGLDACIVRRLAAPTPADAIEAVLRAPAMSEPAADEPAAPALPSRPTPAALARPRAATPAPVAVPVYSSVSGATRTAPTATAPVSIPGSDQVERVAQAVVDAFVASATRAQLVELRTNRPSIPRDLDSALLHDLSDALDVYTLDDFERHALRDAFWECVEALEV